MRTAEGNKIIYIVLKTNANGKSPLLMLVIARIGLSVQNTNLHFKVGRSRLEAKVKCRKIPNLRKDQN